jgi:hypothetical protein
MNDLNSFTKEAWAIANSNTKNELLYGSVINLTKDIKKLHRWKYVNGAITGICSFIGGIVGVWMLAKAILPIIKVAGG